MRSSVSITVTENPGYVSFTVKCMDILLDPCGKDGTSFMSFMETDGKWSPSLTKFAENHIEEDTGIFNSLLLLNRYSYLTDTNIKHKINHRRYLFIYEFPTYVHFVIGRSLEAKRYKSSVRFRKTDGIWNLEELKIAERYKYDDLEMLNEILSMRRFSPLIDRYPGVFDSMNNLYTLFYNNGETHLIAGKSFKDACKNAFNAVGCPSNAIWKEGDYRNQYNFNNGCWVRRFNEKLKPYTLFYNFGKTQLIHGKDFEDACQRAFNKPECPLNAVWKGGDCRNQHRFDRYTYTWVKI